MFGDPGLADADPDRPVRGYIEPRPTALIDPGPIPDHRPNCPVTDSVRDELAGLVVAGARPCAPDPVVMTPCAAPRRMTTSTTACRSSASTSSVPVIRRTSGMLYADEAASSAVDEPHPRPNDSGIRSGRGETAVTAGNPAFARPPAQRAPHGGPIEQVAEVQVDAELSHTRATILAIASSCRRRRRPTRRRSPVPHRAPARRSARRHLDGRPGGQRPAAR